LEEEGEKDGLLESGLETVEESFFAFFAY